MTTLILGTDKVNLDEPCFNLSEVNLQSPGSRGIHRYQILTLVRAGDKLTEFRRDLGLAKRFQASQFRIPGGVMDDLTGKFECLHTVGQLVDIADYLRCVYREDPPQPSNLIEEYYKQMERAYERRV